MNHLYKCTCLAVIALLGSPVVSSAAEFFRQTDTSAAGHHSPYRTPSMTGPVGDDGQDSANAQEMGKKKKKKKKSSAS